MNAIKEFFLADSKQTQKLAASLASVCKAGDVVLLYGEVGAGKTTFARGFIQSLTGSGEDIVSPTFTLVQVYDIDSRLRVDVNAVKIYHCDLYRLKHEQEIEELGLEEAFTNAITLIEWPEIAKSYLPDDALEIYLTIGDGGRKIIIKGNEKWQERLKIL